jgi:hypothetical protein
VLVVTIIARGSKQVADFERALGGRPSKASIQSSRDALNRYVADSLKAERQARAERAALIEPLRELAFGHIVKDDPKVKETIEAIKRSHERRIQHTIAPPQSAKFEAQVALGSIVAIKVPPYDGYWAGRTYHLQKGAAGEGEWYKVHAGLGVRFHCYFDNPQQRVAALIDYSDYWWNDAMFYVADLELRTRLWIWSDATKTWVSRSDVSPQISDHASWFDSDGNGDGESGSLVVEAYFPAYAGTWYTVWLWSRAGVYADGGAFGIADNFIAFDASVPYMVFGSL